MDGRGMCKGGMDEDERVVIGVVVDLLGGRGVVTSNAESRVVSVRRC